MAKPTKVPTWATDADYSNGPEVGTPTKADPGAGVQAEGYIPQTRLAAQVINWWQNLVGQWTSWLDSTFAGGGGDPIEFLEPLDNVHSLGPVGTADDFLYVDESGTPDPRTRTLIVHRADWVPGFSSSFARNPAFVGALTLESGIAEAPIRLPVGAVIKSVTAFVTPGAARAVGDRFKILLRRNLSLIAEGEDDGTTAAQSVTLDSLNHVVADNFVYDVAAHRGTGGSDDALTGVQVVYELYGPT